MTNRKRRTSLIEVTSAPVSGGGRSGNCTLVSSVEERNIAGCGSCMSRSGVEMSAKMFARFFFRFFFFTFI